YKAVDGCPTPWHLAHHGRFALGGVGGAFVEATGVTPEGRITPGCTGLWNDRQRDLFAGITELYHSQGVPVGIQIGHAGRKASAARPWDGAGPLPASDPEAWETVGASAVAMAEGWPAPRALQRAEIDQLVDQFAEAARRAVAAGFDFVEIHGAHGYLIHSFFSPLSNQRSDEFGGDLAGRMRLPLEVAEAVRGAIPTEMPLFYRASAVDGAPDGLQIEDTIALARELKRRGVDVIDCSSGGVRGSTTLVAQAPEPGFQVPYAAAIRREADILTMAVGLILSPRQAEAIVAEGSADLVALGRQLIADPNFSYHAALELGAPEPHDVLPQSYSFYLSRRAASLGANLPVSGRA
ncbi:MAG: NADH:flavin oxidoreductase/NADH oxidase, partial [Rhizobiales bacterium]|nr:NADH:flavin oxidoreductase/NADH oxidase [Hyphomicrobiales bacterium]